MSRLMSSRFAEREANPTGGQGPFVQGGYAGHLSDCAGQLELNDLAGQQVASASHQAPPSPLAGQLILTELNYHPPGNATTDGEEFEFVELTNTGAIPLNLAGFRLSEGIDFAFPVGTVLAPSSYLTLVRNPSAFAARYPAATYAAAYQGQLKNSGDHIALLDSNRMIVESRPMACLPSPGRRWQWLHPGAPQPCRFGG